MISPAFPENEKERQKAVEKYQLLDTLPEANYDNITSLMAYICQTPISLITLLDKDRNFLKSHHGIPFNESPREISFCGHAINSENEITIIEDAREDVRFHDNPLVAEHQAIFYAGVPMVDPQGYKLGTLCVYDTKPRKLTSEQIKALLSMSKQVVHLFEERYQNMQLQKLQKTLELRNKNLEKFAGIVSHDLKSPLAQITGLVTLLKEDMEGNLNEEALQYLEYIGTSSKSLRNYIDGILKFYKADALLKEQKAAIFLEDVLEEVKALFVMDESVTISFYNVAHHVHINKAAFTQIMVNLISNAIKYSDKAQTTIAIYFDETEAAYSFAVKDNGAGIEDTYITEIFELFTTAGKVDKTGNLGTGIGLATVYKVVTRLGGTISVDSVLHEGSTFTFTIEK